MMNDSINSPNKNYNFEDIYNKLKNLICETISINFHSKIHEDCKSNNIIHTIHQNSTIPEAFKKLTEYQVHSLPVIDETNSVISMVSVLHLIDHMLNHYLEENIKKQMKHTFHFFSILIERKEMEKRTINHIKEIGDLEKVIIVSPKTNLFDVTIQILKQKGYRACVCDEKDKHPIQIITLTTIVEILIPTLLNHPISKEKIKNLDLGTKNVITILKTDIVYNAFRKIKENKISSIGVVDENGILIGHFGSGDIKLIGYNFNNLELLDFSIEDFFEIIKESPYLKLRPLEILQKKETVITCYEEDYFSILLQTISKYHIHRVYIVNQEKKPIKIISVFDIMKYFMQNVLV